jgi:hypothetical protein
MFAQVIIELDRARHNYLLALKPIDGALRAIVSKDPTQLAAAQAIQASYTDGIAGVELAGAEQPADTAGARTSAPKRTRKAAKAVAIEVAGLAALAKAKAKAKAKK